MGNISIIVPIYNRIEISKKGIKAIYDSICYYNENDSRIIFNFIVVDDGSTDGSSEWIEKHYPEIKILKGDGNLWWTGSVNLGIAFSIDYYKDNLVGVILQNDDIYVKRDWLLNYSNEIEISNNSLIGCAAVDYNNPDVVIYGGNKIQPWFSSHKNINKGKNIADIESNNLVESYNLIGRGLYIPASVFKKIGLFDQKHFKHRGDTELSLRAKNAGFKLYVSYKCLVYIFPEITSQIDTKIKYQLKDFSKRFFDFRSSAYWKYRFYFAKYQSNNLIQQYLFFSLDMISLLKDFFLRGRLSN